MHLERADRSNDDHTVRRLHTGLSKLDVHEFFETHVGTKPTLCHDIVTKFQCNTVGQHRVVAKSDVGEWSNVNKGGRAFFGLNQIGIDSILEDSSQAPGCPQVRDRHDLSTAAVRNDNLR